MAKVKVLNKDVKKENENLIVTKTTEETLTRMDLEREKQNCNRQKQQLRQRAKRVKEEYNYWDNKEREIDDLIAQLPEEQIETL